MSLTVPSALTALLLTLTVLPLSRHEAWWVRGWAFPRLQLFVLALGLMAADLALLDWRGSAGGLLVALAPACAVWQGWWIAPYTRLYACEARDASAGGAAEHRLSLMSANVLMSNRRSDALLALAPRPGPMARVSRAPRPRTTGR